MTVHRSRDRTRSVLVGFMLGVSIMAAVDEIVFHQLLAWHHFYDRSTPDIALLSDGLLQTGYLVLLVAGFFLFADLRRTVSLAAGSAWAGWFLGLGSFQLLDGLMNHKVLRVHQIRYEVDQLLPYDLAWNGGAMVLIAVGAGLLWRTRHEASPETQSGHPIVQAGTDRSA